MIRLASWIIGSLVIAGIAAWVIALPGTLTLELAGYRMQPRLGTAVVILLVAAALVIAIWAITRRIIGAPRVMAKRRAARRREQGVDALSDAVIALQAGDPARARLTRQLIRELNAEGKTIFLTTHNMAEADEICHRVGFLVDGRADVIDAPAALKQRFGTKTLKITTRRGAELPETHEFALDDLADNTRFMSILRSGTIETMHTQEASLDDIFIKVAGGLA